MRIAVMQPYFFPYIGYFQLMHAVDRFVLFDDVNFINRGWIHRNRILVNGEARWVGLSLKNRSQNRLICDHQIEEGKSRNKIASQVLHAYRKAPYFDKVFPWLSDALTNMEPELATYLRKSLLAVMEYVGVPVDMVFSSSLAIDEAKKGQGRILSICGALGAREYLNLPGGRGLYSSERFVQSGIKLRFLESDPLVYPQFSGQPVSSLSIIDVLMFNHPETVRGYLTQCRWN